MKAIFQFRSFRNLIVSALLLLLLLVLGLVYVAVNRSSYQSTRDVIDESLIVSSEVFQRLMQERAESFLLTSRVLALDFAFRSAYFSNDYDTRLSVTNNHLARIGNADIMMIIDLDDAVEVDSSLQFSPGTDFPWTYLLNQAYESDSGEVSSVILINGIPYQVVVTPLLSPDLRAWIMVGRVLDDEFLLELKNVLGSDISLVSYSGSGADVLSSSLEHEFRNSLASQFKSINMGLQSTQTVTLEEGEFVSLGYSLLEEDGVGLIALVQQSLNEALLSYRQLEKTLILLFILALGGSAIMAFALGRSITQPLLALARRVRLIESGNFEQQPVRRKDELGQLAHSINTMAGGLAEKEKVRDLLGKVVSHEIAEELLGSQIELGGEEKEVTILFADIERFTELCENRPPSQVLSFLNQYLSQVSDAVEAHKGVIDKFIGDAVMALYGAPISHNNDVDNALLSALAIQSVMKELNARNRESDWPALEAGIGIHTGKVVAGNLGSNSRLNYSVIGDSVNLASRLESLTRYYGVGVIVSAETQQKAKNFSYRLLDSVQVKGRKAPVILYELVALTENLNIQQQKTLQEQQLLNEQMWQAYKNQNWQQAERYITKMRLLGFSEQYCNLFLGRIQQFRLSPPDESWQGVYSFTQK